MENYRAGLTLAEAIKEAQEDEEVYLIEEPHERAAAIADWVRREYPFAWHLKSMQDAAARAVGVPTHRELEREYQKVEEATGGRSLGEELTRMGLILLGLSGLFVVGELYPGALGTAITGIVLVFYGNSLDKSR